MVGLLHAGHPRRGTGHCINNFAISLNDNVSARQLEDLTLMRQRDTMKLSRLLLGVLITRFSNPMMHIAAQYGTECRPMCRGVRKCIWRAALRTFFHKRGCPANAHPTYVSEQFTIRNKPVKHRQMKAPDFGECSVIDRTQCHWELYEMWSNVFFASCWLEAIASQFDSFVDVSGTRAST